jgi:hypothetical protein
MITLHNLASELAATWAQQLLASRLPLQSTLSVIRQIDRARADQRHELIARYQITNPEPPVEVLHTDDLTARSATMKATRERAAVKKRERDRARKQAKAAASKPAAQRRTKQPDAVGAL